MPDTRGRVALALGPEPPEDARHLLRPVDLPPPSTPLPPGPRAAVDFVVRLEGNYPIPAAGVWAAFGDTAAIIDLGFFRLWAQRPERSPFWRTGEEIPTEGPLIAAALTWKLSSLLSSGRAAAEELAGYVLRAGERAAPLGLTAVAAEEPHRAAGRAARLTSIRDRFAKTVEMRLVPQGRAFPARQVWRTAYAMGLEWGDMDLLHWRDPAAGVPLFSVSSLGKPGYFLPERAAEGEGVPGIALAFELPRNPAPVETYDRMAMALAYFRQRLGGRPLTADGAELDADRLDEDRDALERAVTEMSAAGVPPGSAEAEAFF